MKTDNLKVTIEKEGGSTVTFFIKAGSGDVKNVEVVKTLGSSDRKNGVYTKILKSIHNLIFNL